MGDQRIEDVAETHPPIAGPDDVAAATRRPWATPWVWVLAFMPWVIAAGVVLTVGALLSSALSIRVGYPDWIWVLLLLVPYLLTVVVAGLDAGQLRAWQHPTVAPWAWAWLGAPVYLVARSFALQPRARHGLRPMWVGLVNAAVATLAVVVGFTVIAVLATWFLALLADSMGANRY
ncbi:hypothetical protein [Cryobacterium sp. N22]|uniref:hypothetical protein n=1 Tax=Cryobacterium sp. N22 TaxID=2048290 RepID=UPI0011B0E4D2|nr:hypothetical protein [Cryobacterium sp. N22]